MATEDPSLTPQEQAKLKAFAQGLPDEPGDIDVDAIAQETGTSRRQVLQIIAAVGVGSIAGGVSVSQLVSEAQAQASTSDSDGNVGTPADRVDVFADGVDASVIDTGKQTITAGRHILMAAGEINATYSGDLAGLRSALADAADGDAVIPAPGTYNLGTTPLDFSSKKLSFGRPGNKRTVAFQASDGIGVAVKSGPDCELRNFRINGVSNPSNEDIGLQPATGAGFTTAYNLEISNFWKNLYLDNHFNSRWIACGFDKARTVTNQGASIHVDTASGSNNDTRFLAPFFGLNDSRCVWVQANNVSLVAPHGEGNSGGSLYFYEFGGQFNIVRAMHHGESVTNYGLRAEGGSPCYFSGILNRDSGLSASGTAFSIDGSTDVAIIEGQASGSWSSRFAASTGARRLFNGVGRENIAGNTSNLSSEWHIGDVVEDNDNPGDLYLLTVTGNWTQIGT